MTGRRNAARVETGDWMPRVTLPTASGDIFDSWDFTAAGQIRVYWLGEPPADTEAMLEPGLAACEASLLAVCRAPVARQHVRCLIDPRGEFEAAFGAGPSAAIVVDWADRVAAILSPATPVVVLAVVTRLHQASRPEVITGRAPVLMLERVVAPDLCRDLVAYWQRSEKRANRVGSLTGNVVNADVKRRLDVQVDEPGLLARLRADIGKRVVPAILRAFQIGIMVIEAPIVGCYDADEGGRFGRHRDNTSSHTAHRQFALSINLNPDDEYQGGEVMFPEFGRELYRPTAGGALVFSTSLLHEVTRVRKGRRFGVFTFLSATAPQTRRG